MKSKLSVFFLSLILVLFSSQFTSAMVIYVAHDASGSQIGADWTNACTSITAGLTATASGDEVWVKQGRYNESITMKVGVALYGGFIGGENTREARSWTANETIIDATGLETHVVVGANLATLDGFTVTGGFAVNGGGVYCSNTSPQISNCTITGNVSDDSDGGGLYCDHAYPKLTNCEFESNSASQGGGLYCTNSSPKLNDCTFMDNSAWYGGGLYFDNSSPSLANCIIRGNQAYEEGGGLNCSESILTLVDTQITDNSSFNSGGVHFAASSPKLINCLISGNSASSDAGGFGCSDSSSSELINCVIAGNSASSAGGLEINGFSSLTLINCTVAENSGENGDWIRCDNDADVSVINSILWNTGGELVDEENISITYSCVRSGWVGEGNLDDDPRFVDTANNNFTLQNGSPCIDRGLTYNSPLKDILGNPRPWQ